MTEPVTILLATPETDARLREEQMTFGLRAKRLGLPRDHCPHDPASLVARWWFEGYDSYPDPETDPHERRTFP